jgi:CheY-like chemotaxis protein
LANTFDARSVLVVEDDKDIREALKDVLESEGYTVQSASNGERALAYLKSAAELPSVILLDLMMPVMDGFQFRTAQLADAKLAKVPVVVMSANASVEDKTAVIGAHAYLKKPVDIDQVIAMVAQFAN